MQSTYNDSFKNYTTYIDHLGKGMSGNVDLHKINASGERVAIKTIVSTKGKENMFGNSEDPFATVVKELHCMQVLYQCPYIVKLLDVNIFDDGNTSILQFMMPYYRYDLEHYMADMDTYKRIMYFDGIADNMLHALNNLYYRGIIHADIKPANILIDVTGNVPVAYLADFGLSTQLPCESTIRTVHMGIRGSPIYMAPEILLGKEYYNEKVDIWALGVTLLTYLTNYEFTYPSAELLNNYDSIESILYGIFKLLSTPLLDTYKNYDRAKSDDIHDTIDVVNVLEKLIPDELHLINKGQIDLLLSLLQFNANDRLASTDLNHAVCPRVKDGLVRGSLNSVDITMYYKAVYKIIRAAHVEKLQPTTCFAAIWLLERYVANFSTSNPFLLAAGCIMLMSEFYEYKYLKDDALTKYFGIKLTYNSLYKMQLMIMKKANYVVTYCDMDPVLHKIAEEKYFDAEALTAIKKAFETLQDKNVFSGDVPVEEIATMI